MKTSYLAGMSITVICVSIAILVYDGASSNSHSSFEHKDHHPADSSHSDSHASDTHKTRQLTTSNIKVFPIPNATEIDHDLAKIGWVLFKDPNLPLIAASVAKPATAFKPTVLKLFLYQ